MHKYENGYWIWKCDLDKLKGILLRDARNETIFTKWCISEAIENKKRSTRPPTRAEIEAAEALTEDIEL
jgi:hypothetical protein